MLVCQKENVLDPVEWVLAFSRGDQISEYLAYCLLGPRVGVGALPLDLGLGNNEFSSFVEKHFPGLGVVLSGFDLRLESSFTECSDTRTELGQMRYEEIIELVNLLEQYRNPLMDPAISNIVATACLGGDHLWRDLGLTDRADLSDLMTQVYPQLKAKNDKDMKWKRFFYKMLCDQDGGYMCRAPSCDQCTAYSDCFGPEV